MALHHVDGMLLALKAIPSKNDKLEQLRRYKSSPQWDEFKEVAYLALHPDLRYSVKSMGKFSGGDFCYEPGQERFLLDYLKYLSTKQGIKDDERAMLCSLASINSSAFSITNKIIKKNLDCGCGVKTINKVIPNFIRTTPYMRCMDSAEGMKRIDYSEGAYVQRKADATFAYAFMKNGIPTIISRNGMVMNFLGVFDADIMLLEGRVISMEVISVDQTGKELPREVSNGRALKALRGTITQKEVDSMRGVCWDIMPDDIFISGYWGTPYVDRLSMLRRVVEKMSRIRVVETWEVYSQDEALDIANSIIRGGGEGVVIKNKNGFWEDKTSPNQVKFKRKKVAEFRFTGWYRGDLGKKYEDCMGGIYIETECGQLKGKVASGFTDAHRGYCGTDSDGARIIDKSKMDYLDSLVGSVVSVEYDSLMTNTCNDKPAEYSLFLPIFQEFRFDKEEADTLEYLLKA